MKVGETAKFPTSTRQWCEAGGAQPKQLPSARADRQQQNPRLGPNALLMGRSGCKLDYFLTFCSKNAGPVQCQYALSAGFGEDCRYLV